MKMIKNNFVLFVLYILSIAQCFFRSRNKKKLVKELFIFFTMSNTMKTKIPQKFSNSTIDESKLNNIKRK